MAAAVADLSNLLGAEGRVFYPAKLEESGTADPKQLYEIIRAAMEETIQGMDPGSLAAMVKKENQAAKVAADSSKGKSKSGKVFGKLAGWEGTATVVIGAVLCVAIVYKKLYNGSA